MRILFLDIEASGLGPGTYPVSVALVPLRSPGRDWLIRPTPAWRRDGRWDPQAEALHGLSLDQLEQQGQPVDQVAAAVEAATADHAVFSDAPSVDRYWITRLFEAVARPVPFILQPVTELFEDLADGGLAGAAQIEDAQALARQRHPVVHQALPDASRLAEVARILIEGIP